MLVGARCIIAGICIVILPGVCVAIITGAFIDVASLGHQVVITMAMQVVGAVWGLTSLKVGWGWEKK